MFERTRSSTAKVVTACAKSFVQLVSVMVSLGPINVFIFVFVYC